MGELDGGDGVQKFSKGISTAKEGSSSQKMTPAELVAMWEDEKPWETPPARPQGLRGMFVRRMQEPVIRSFGHDSAGGNELSQYVKMDIKGRKDVRGWVLEKLGLSDYAKGKVVDEYEAADLIAKGLGISHFQAGILDFATRGLPNEQVAHRFKDVLLHPEKFASRELFEFAEQVEGLTRQQWDALRKSESDWRGKVYSTDNKELSRRARTAKVYPHAFTQMATAAFRRAHGAEDFHRDEFSGVSLPENLAIRLEEKVITADQARQELNSYALHI